MNKIFAIGLILLPIMTGAHAGGVYVPGLSGSNVIKVESFKERKFRHVTAQKFDFSCGSAALSTLLTYHYEDQTSEADAFNRMYQVGDKEKISTEGFSLLDMKNYLSERGYQADGYRLGLDKIAEVGVPIIVLLNTEGYMHFVVVKGIGKDEILVGDSALGRKIYQRKDFENKWNGIAFLIRNKANISKKRFNLDDDWLVTHRYPIENNPDSHSIANLVLNLPNLRDF